MKNITFLALAVAASSSALTAQSQAAFDRIQVANIGTATIDMATGEITRGENNDKNAGLLPAFDNTDFSGVCISTGPITNTSNGKFIEWLDFGDITTDTGSDIVGSFTFGYGTTVTDTILSGPGVQISLNFYDGTVGSCADFGAAPIANFSFTSLPGSPGNRAAGWLITVDLQNQADLLFCTPGVGNNFGFGFTTTDDYNGDLLRDTGPLLCYAGDPFSGGGATVDEDSNGQLNIYDQWDADPTLTNCLGTLNFGSFPFNYASFYLTINTVDTERASKASATFRNDTDCPNPGNYLVQDAPILGETFNATDQQSSGGSSVLIFGFVGQLNLKTKYGVILCDIFNPELLTPFNGPYPFFAGTATISIPVPKDLTLCGFAFCTQTVEIGNGAVIHNAQDLVAGF